MDPELTFFFYFVALICFLLATAGDGWRYGRRPRRDQASVPLLPLGLALALVPTVWNSAEAAF
jgi:hypothetical protein